MQAVLRIDGKGNSMLMHHERLADPLDPHARAVAELAAKRKRTDSENLELAHREFIGGLYTNGNGPCVPTWNVLRCLQNGAKRRKRGKDVIRGVFPLVEEVDLLYDGPRETEKLWKEEFWIRKGIVISGRRMPRTRPCFTDFAAEIPIEIDPDILDLDIIEVCWFDAGRYEGIGDYRPGAPSGGPYGRFIGTVLSEQEWLKQANGKSKTCWRSNETAIKRVLAEHETRVLKFA